MKYLIIALLFFSSTRALSQSADGDRVATKEEMRRVKIPLHLAITMGWNSYYRFLFLDKWERQNVRGVFKLFIDPPGHVYFKARRSWMAFYRAHPGRIPKDFP